MKNFLGLVLCGIGFSIVTLGFKLCRDEGKQIIVDQIGNLLQKK